MSTYTESIVIPKQTFLRLKKEVEERSVDDNKQAGGGSDLSSPAVVGEDSKQAQFRKFLEEKRRHSYVKNVGATSGLLKEASITPQDEQDLLTMFPPETQFKVKRLLLLLRRHSNLVTWDPKTYELTIFGKHYPKSNIIDIISYLLGMNVQGKWMSEDEEHNFPRQTNTFVQVLQKALEGGTVEDYGFLNPDKFHKAAKAEAEDIPPDDNDNTDEVPGPYNIPLGNLFDEESVKPGEEMIHEVRDREAEKLIAAGRFQAAKAWITTELAKDRPDYFLIEKMKLHVKYLEKLRALTLADLKNERDGQILVGNKLYSRAATSVKNSKRKLYDTAIVNVGSLKDLIRMTPGELETLMAREATLHNWDYYAKLREALDVVTSAPPYGFGGPFKKMAPPPADAPGKDKRAMTPPVPAQQPALVVPPLPPGANDDDDDDAVAAAADIIAGAAATDDAAAAADDAAAAAAGVASSTNKRAETKAIDANQFKLSRQFEGATTRGPKRARKETNILDIGTYSTESEDKKKRAESER
jgi:hypothetical protein